MRKIIVRWTATYETIIEVPKGTLVGSKVVKDAAANIDITVEGSEYQSDTWEVEAITPK